VHEQVTLHTADGATLAVHLQRPEQEQGAALILLHGAASNHTRWWHFNRHSQLGQHHRLLCPDLRGHGDSIWRGPATLDHWCRDLAQLLDQQKLQSAILIGHCLGANLAIHFAARFPERCAGLVLIEPMLRPALRGTLARLEHFAPLLSMLVVLTRLINRLGVYRRRLRRVDLEQLDRDWHTANQSSDVVSDMADRYGSPWHDLKAVPTGQYLGNLLAVMQLPPLADVRCPALAILPTGWRMTDPERTREALSRLSSLEVCGLDADHWIPTRQPDAMVACIDDWVAQLGTLTVNGR
jgi:esterase